MGFSRQEYWSRVPLPSYHTHTHTHIYIYILYIYVYTYYIYIYVYTHIFAHAAAAKSLQSCSTLCDPIDSSPPGSMCWRPGILQARTPEGVAISFSNAWEWKMKVKSLSHVRLFATPWTTAHQAPLSMGFFRQEYQSGVPLPSPIFIHIYIWLCGWQ